MNKNWDNRQRLVRLYSKIKMASGLKCRNCYSTDIEVDNARGDAVCTNCGSVLEDSLIVSEIQFEEVGRGTAAIGQFVSAETSGGATHYGYGKFQVGSGNESREVTIKKAKKEITHLCQQLNLNQHYIDTAVNFFKMALMRNLTRGRKSTHIYAACVYITCRTEGTSHLLIDISDVQQICSYELGRTYLKLSTSLCINIPAIDPCLYILRFANKLQFGNKTHEVSMTALRIVQRMKKDSIHSGRRPTGLCGAALLIAARMHEFNRTIHDVVRIVKIHESTVRKRLTEFADTPSSSLTLDEFMSVDLEAEQDPPAFKAARKKDRDRIKDIGEHELTELQKKIDALLEKDMLKQQNSALKYCFKDASLNPDIGEANFLDEVNLETIQKCVPKPKELKSFSVHHSLGIKPNIEFLCQVTQRDLEEVENAKGTSSNQEIYTGDFDDSELDNFILTHQEAGYKNTMWNALHEDYLKSVKERDEKLAKEREEGKPEKKRRKPRKKVIGPSVTAGEAIEKMLQEKKISSKINYDILKTLTQGSNDNVDNDKKTITMVLEDPIKDEEMVEAEKSKPAKESSKSTRVTEEAPLIKRVKHNEQIKEMPIGLSVEPTNTSQLSGVPETTDEEFDTETEPEMEPEPEPEPDQELSSLKTLLNDSIENDYYDYDDHF